MSNVINFITRFTNQRILVLFIIIGALVVPFFAYASLGDDEVSAKDDQIYMNGALRTTINEAYTVHKITDPNGLIVREYVSSTGKVFAVSWQGPFFPNLQQLLGRYFDQFSQASKTRNNNSPRIRGPLLIQQPGLVVQSSGHMRAYSGRAYIPDMVPLGMDIEEVQ